MPTSVAELFVAAGLVHEDVVPWGRHVAVDVPGAYVVARTDDPSGLASARDAHISRSAVEQLLDARPELRLDGQRPTPERLAARLASFWLPDESVVYVGLAGTSVRSRLGAYHRTALGARRPHSGGWFLKTLADLEALSVHVARADDPAGAEGDMLRRFCAGVSEGSRRQLHDPERPFPFANLEWPPGTQKRHGITGARQPRPRP